jgi:beta-N-acetylhexosaminidase
VTAGRPRAAIIGLSGLSLTSGEAALLRRSPPLGAILFARNIESPDQVLMLTAVLVDQEGGRVARLREPHWSATPAAAEFAGGPEAPARANAALIGLACRAVGLDVVCAPVLDLRLPETHAVIGDRAFSDDPAEIARLGGAWIEGLQEAGCIPVIKHIPGHGRATVDSHHALPHVDADRDLLAQDCGPFRALAGSGAWAMTAHILYEAFDPRTPATLSTHVIQRVIRHAIGFDGLLLTDDLAMGALRGAPAALAQHAIAAGCDVALHCTGVLEDTAALLEDCPTLSGEAERRLAESRIRVEAMRRTLDPVALAGIRDQRRSTAA